MVTAIQEFVWATVCSDCYTIKMVTTHNNNIYYVVVICADSRTRVQQYKKSSLVWHLNLWTDRTLYQIQDRLQWPAVHLFFHLFFTHHCHFLCLFMLLVSVKCLETLSEVDLNVLHFNLYSTLVLLLLHMCFLSVLMSADWKVVNECFGQLRQEKCYASTYFVKSQKTDSYPPPIFCLPPVT